MCIDRKCWRHHYFLFHCKTYNFSCSDCQNCQLKVLSSFSDLVCGIRKYMWCTSQKQSWNRHIPQQGMQFLRNKINIIITLYYDLHQSIIEQYLLCMHKHVEVLCRFMYCIFCYHDVPRMSSFLIINYYSVHAIENIFSLISNLIDH
jgi:hypothetical protein